MVLEQNLVSREEVECQVCPVILELTQPHAMDDFRTEAVAVSTRGGEGVVGVLFKVYTSCFFKGLQGLISSLQQQDPAAVS